MLILITARSESEYAFRTAGYFVCDQRLSIDVHTELSLALWKLCRRNTEIWTPEC